MAQTPVSASAVYSSTTPTTIYTVPTSKTAVVKGVLASSLTTTFDTVTLNKVSGGVTYPLVRGQLTGYTSWSAGTYFPAGAGVQSINLLQSPITLAAGDSISISTTGTSYYKTENVVNNSSYKIANINYLNGYYIAVGLDSSTGYGLILTSTDGITFTSRTFTAAVTLTNSTYGNGYYVVCNSTGGTIHYSTDLITWTQVTLPSTYACYALTYGGGKFVTGGSAGYSYYATTTPLSWTAATVFLGNTIYTISYIGTNYFYGNAGVSYYTSDFTNYTQPYVYLLSGNSQSKNGNFAVTNNKVLGVNSLIASTTPNGFLTSSTTGATWSNVTTVANSLASYSTYICYTNNGGHMIYRTTSSGQQYYLYSSDGVSWAESNTSGLNGETATVNSLFRAAFDNTTNASLNNKVYGYFGTSSRNFFCYDQTTSGTQGTINWQFASPLLAAGTAQIQTFPCYVANPNDGSWIALAFYSQGGNYTVAFWYGTGPTQQAGDSQFAQSFYNNGYGQGYSVSAGVVPGSDTYLVGTQNGWVIQGTFTSIGTPLIQSGVYGANPPGITWSGVLSGSECVGFARSGNTSTSTLVILWANGQIAVTTNQCASFTQKSIGASSFTRMSAFGGSPIKYNNGMFVAINTSGLVLTSTNGLDWVTMPSNVESIYYLNSQNVFLSTSNLTTSATGVVNAFTGKTNPGSGNNPSVNRMVYANSTYYLTGVSGEMYTSSDLVTWTSKTFNSTQINNTTYISVGGMGLAYSGSGTTILPSAALMSTPTSGTIGKAFTPSSGTVVGNAIASIVEIS